MAKEDDPKKKPTKTEAAAEVPAIAVPNERTNFKKLLLSNPNFSALFRASEMSSKRKRAILLSKS